MMEITVTQEKSVIPVAILQVEGRLDGSNYGGLITEAQALYDAGRRDLVLDLTKLTYLSSAGISALHRVALLFQGKRSAELEEGWAAFRAMDRDRGTGTQQHVKLLNPTKEVRGVLEMVGFTAFFEIYADIHTAVASFQ
jgi:anti-anti-sigma regulatory factor